MDFKQQKAEGEFFEIKELHIQFYAWNGAETRVRPTDDSTDNNPYVVYNGNYNRRS